MKFACCSAGQALLASDVAFLRSLKPTAAQDITLQIKVCTTESVRVGHTWYPWCDALCDESEFVCM
jgi:hypothetical protein